MDEDNPQLPVLPEKFTENDKLFQPQQSGSKLPYFIFGFVILAGVAIGGYLLGAAQSNSTHVVNKQILHTQTPTAPPSPTPPSKLSFQDTISTYCKQQSGTSYPTMDISKIPLKINPAVLIATPSGELAPKCWNSKGHGYFFFGSAKGDYYFNVFDDASIEIGRDGSPVLTPIGVKFYDENGIKLYFYRFEQMGSYIGTEPVTIEGFKTLTWPTGKNVYITTQAEAISATDPRLLQLLNKNAVVSQDDFSKGHMVVDNEQQADNDVKSVFFSNVATMQNPEKEAVDSLIQVLNAFSIQ